MGEWYEEFFGADYLTRYPEDEAATALEVDQMVSLLGVAPPARILDLACGYGRHALGLARCGFSVVGFDLSTDLLQEARRRADEQGSDVQFLQGDMRRVPFLTEFDAVINVFTSFGYFDEAGNRRVIQEVAKSLRPGGRFLLELLNRDGLLPRFQPRVWQETADGFLLTETSYDPFTSRTQGRSVLISRAGGVKEHALSTRAYSLHELRTLVLAAGFVDVEAYGALDGSPFLFNGPRTVLVARRS